MLLVRAVVTCGCSNRAVFDAHCKFDEAIVALPDYGVVAKGRVSGWRDYEDGDQLQVTIDGATYCAHASNVVLIDK